MQYSVQKYLEALWRKYGGRMFTVLCGDQWGDNGKGTAESALSEFFEAFVRLSGGANTGRTRYVMGKDGLLHQFIFHLIPTGWADGKIAIIGDRVLVDIERLTAEIRDLVRLIGQPKGPLYLSKKAPVFLKVHRLCEMWIEHVKGKHGIKPTGRGIGPQMAFSDLKMNLLVGHLYHPDLLERYVREAYAFLGPIITVMDELGLIDKGDYTPEREIEDLLIHAKEIEEYVVDLKPILFDLAERNVPTLFGLTQGFGLHYEGSYPFTSSTETVASSASYCTGLPMKFFGPTIMVSKLLPTRVGAGPFPTGWWDRQAAEDFPKQRPELFSDLEACDEGTRGSFLAELKEKINAGVATDAEKAMYFMVLLNELGATTKRGREMGYPDLHVSDCACAVNGVDSVILTRVDALSGLKLDLPVCRRYRIDGHEVPRYVFPTPAETMDRAEPIGEPMEIDLRGVDLAGLGSEAELPGDIQRMIDVWEERLGVPLSLSFSPKPDGKVFRL